MNCGVRVIQGPHAPEDLPFPHKVPLKTPLYGFCEAPECIFRTGSSPCHRLASFIRYLLQRAVIVVQPCISPLKIYGNQVDWKLILLPSQSKQSSIGLLTNGLHAGRKLRQVLSRWLRTRLGPKSRAYRAGKNGTELQTPSGGRAVGLHARAEY